MLVNRYSSFRFKEDYGKSTPYRRVKMKRAIRRREKRTWKLEL